MSQQRNNSPGSSISNFCNQFSQKDDMRQPGRTRRKIFSVILAIGISLTVPYIVFGAGRTSKSSGRLRAPKMRPQHSYSQRLSPFAFWGVGGVGEQQTVIIEQGQPAPTIESIEPATNRIYVQPRWVDGGHGVQVSVPGYWTHPNQAPKR